VPAERSPNRFRVPVRFQLRPHLRFRLPRRLRVQKAGGVIIAGTLALGLATLNTGNNLLYLLMGALLGTIALSGWLSERALRRLRVVRRLPRAGTAGEPLPLIYQVVNDKRSLPSYAVEIRELGPRAGSRRAPAPWENEPAFIASLEPGAATRVRGRLTASRRGVFRLEGVVLATSFPFGLFSKERDLVLPGRLVIWPRADRLVRVPRPGGTRGARWSAGSSAAPVTQRGEYRSLREYRPGDDPRDIHWRSTASRGGLITREYDRAAVDEYWIVLDTLAPDEDAAEAAVELAASLVAAAVARGDRFGLAAGPVRVPPGATSGSVDRALDVLAAVVMQHDGQRAAEPGAPVGPEQCVLVTARAAVPGGWGDVFRVDP
jgi:uncharacterized protein (DUF58 family)